MSATNVMPERMQQSDRLEEIYAEYSPKLLRYIRAQVSSVEDAEDILHDVFYQLARTPADAGFSEISRMSSWLYRVARNSVLNFWRKRREVSIETVDVVCEDLARTLFCPPQETPDVTYLRSLVWDELEQALTALPPEQSEVFCLTVFDGIPVKEIAQATGVPVATLLSRKHYAVRFLRKRFHELYSSLILQD